jgi:hypothetical protein
VGIIRYVEALHAYSIIPYVPATLTWWARLFEWALLLKQAAGLELTGRSKRYGRVVPS